MNDKGLPSCSTEILFCARAFHTKEWPPTRPLQIVGKLHKETWGTLYV
jgi:hypothetical protein